MRKKKKSSANNIWNKEGFLMCGLGEKCMFLAKIKYIKKCICWSYQRTTRGYSDYDKWNMYSFLQTLIPEMLHSGSALFVLRLRRFLSACTPAI